MKVSQKKYREAIRPTEEWYKLQRAADDHKKRSAKSFRLTPWMLEGMRKNSRHLT